MSMLGEGLFGPSPSNNRQLNQQDFIIAIAVLIVLGGLYFSSNKGDNKKTVEDDINNVNQVTNMTNVLGVVDLMIGSGEEAKTGETLTVHYVGTLVDGKKFDSSYDRGEPFSFTLGAGQVIRGWDEGMLGMKVGGKRKLVIPPDFGYGARDVGNGLIPANSTLVFEVELLGKK